MRWRENIAVLRRILKLNVLYCPIRRYIRGADSLCRWLDGQGIAVVEANQSHIERYVLQHARCPTSIMRRDGYVKPR
jgi:hypothetical protein